MDNSKRLTNWNTKEDKYLIDNYGNSRAVDIANKLGRSKRAVERRAFRLGISNKTPKVNIDTVRAAFSKEGLLLITDFYNNSKQKLKFECSAGHKAEITWNKFQNGRRCPRCYYDPEDMFLKIKKSFEEDGYTIHLCKNDYYSSKQKIKFTCPSAHEYEISWDCFGSGQRCAKCNPNTSKAEEEIANFIISQGIEVQRNVKGLLDNFEVDIYIPKKNLAIEYCGLRWHGEVFSGRGRRYHFDKFNSLYSKRIRLITIFEDEFLERPQVVFGRILTALGIFKKKVYARKMKFSEVPLRQAKKFFSETHLQGYSPCSLRFGLYNGSELIQMMTFGKTSRFHAGGKRIIELKRLSSVPEILVVGGVQKLFKNSLLFFEDKYDYVKSYCDMRWANPFNNVYERLGFAEVGSTKYTPHYIKNQKRYRNQTLRKNNEERLTGKTEWQLRQEQGYDRIWDCGHRTYIFEIKGGR